MSFKAMPKRIRQFRKNRGLTMKELAELCSTSQQQIDRLEKGQRKLTLEWLEKLSHAMECSMAEFLPNSYHDNSEGKTSRAKVIGSVGGSGNVDWFEKTSIYDISFSRPKLSLSPRLFALIINEDTSGYKAGTELIFSDLSGDNIWDILPNDRLAIHKYICELEKKPKHKLVESTSAIEKQDVQAVLVKVIQDLG